MDWLIPAISIVVASALLAFWAWMFWDMLNNDRLPGNSKNFWTLGFVFVSIFAAMYYYMNEYKDRP